MSQAGVLRLRSSRRCSIGALFALLALFVLGGPAPAGAATGDISTVAGSGFAGFSGDGGLATSAAIGRPMGVALAPDGTMYIADVENHRVRKVSPFGLISTFAGTGTPGYSGDDGAATLAQLSYPVDVAVDASGAVYISDYGNHVVRKVSASGVITRFAGTGRSGFPATAGRPATPSSRAPSGSTSTRRATSTSSIPATTACARSRPTA